MDAQAKPQHNRNHAGFDTKRATGQPWIALNDRFKQAIGRRSDTRDSNAENRALKKIPGRVHPHRNPQTARCHIDRAKQDTSLQRNRAGAPHSGIWVTQVHKSKNQRGDGQGNPRPKTFFQKPKQNATKEGLFKNADEKV